MYNNIIGFKFDYGQTVQIVETAPNHFYPGALVSVVGMWKFEQDSFWSIEKHTIGTILYLIEYENGYTLEISEKYLKTKVHGSAPSGHGHEFPPGLPASGHNDKAQHIPYNQLPPGWSNLPPGIDPNTPIQK